MTQKSKLQNKKPKANLSTAQLCALAHISGASAYVYYRTYPEFFSKSSMVEKPGPPGRSWSIDDLQLVQAIRFFRHQRISPEKIRELLAGGFRLQGEPWTQELITSLISAALDAMEEAQAAYQQAGAMKNILQERTRQNAEFQSLWIMVNDLRVEWKAVEKGMGFRSELIKHLKIKKAWHGEPPDLFPQT
jgi:DNA-binding transcriptional MerR regulator